MAKMEWAFHVVASDGAMSVGFPTKKAAEKARKEFIEQGFDMVTKPVNVAAGTENWVVHVRTHKGDMQSFGFETRAEAKKFHNALKRTEGYADIISLPSKAVVA